MSARATCCAIAAALGAVTALGAQSIPVRVLSPVLGTTSEHARLLVGEVRQLPDGRVLVNDGSGRRLLVYDSTLSHFTVLRDSVAGRADSYGPRTGGLIAYLGDSTLFVDAESRTFGVIDPGGRFVRTMAIPNSNDIGFVINRSAIDGRGGLVYRMPERVPPQKRGEGTTVIERPDSMLIVRGDFDTRRTDTIGKFKIVIAPTTERTETSTATRMRLVVNPLQSTDEWAMTSDGSIAIVRGHDYHIDWIDAKGVRSSTPKLPFDWRRLTDEDKQRMIDSARHLADSVEAERHATGGDRAIIIGAGGDRPDTKPTITETAFVPLNQIPDYYPPIASGGVRADRDNNVWILPVTTTQSINGELVYDVVNRKGELFERVRMPAGRSIAGFGPGGVVYLMYREEQGWLVEKRIITLPTIVPRGNFLMPQAPAVGSRLKSARTER